MTNCLSCFSDALKMYHNLSRQLAAMIVWKISLSEGIYICAVITLIRFNMLSANQDSSSLCLHYFFAWVFSLKKSMFHKILKTASAFGFVIWVSAWKAKNARLPWKEMHFHGQSQTTFSERSRRNNGRNCPTCCL